MDDELKELRLRIQQLDQALQDGSLSPDTHRSARFELEQSLVAHVLAQPTDAPADEPMVPVHASEGLASEVPPAPERIAGAVPRGLWVAVGLIALAAVGAGYWWLGSPAAPPEVGTRSIGQLATANRAPHPTGNDQMAAMVQRLADRLKAQPADAEGWAMLARSYANLGRHAEALAAYAKAVELRRDDPPLMADYADELALQQGGRLEGEPMSWVKRALALDADQPKALLLAGTEAFQRKDHAQAARHWERVVQSGPPQSEIVKQAQAGLEAVRRASN
jgi:cytochrome c-type biogenesis protein CcmH